MKLILSLRIAEYTTQIFLLTLLENEIESPYC